MLGSSLTPSSPQASSAKEPNDNPDDWPLPAVLAFLDAQSLSQYATLFRDNEIYGRAFLELTHETLRKLGIATVSERARLLNATRKMRNASFRKTSTIEQSELPVFHATTAASEGSSNLGHARFHHSKNMSASSATSDTSPLSALSTYLRSLSPNATGPLFPSSTTAPVLISNTNTHAAFSNANVFIKPPTICDDRTIGVINPRTSSRNIPAIIVSERQSPTTLKTLPPVTFPLQGISKRSTAVVAPIDVPHASKTPHISIGNSAISISQSPSTTSLSNSQFDYPLGASLSSSDFCFQNSETEMDSLGILGHVSGYTPSISHMEPNTQAVHHSQNLTQYTHHLSNEGLYTSPCIELTPIGKMEVSTTRSIGETDTVDTCSHTMKSADSQYGSQSSANLNSALPSYSAENMRSYPRPVEMLNTIFSSPANHPLSQTPPVFSVRTSSRFAKHPPLDDNLATYSPPVEPFYNSDLPFPDHATAPNSSKLTKTAGYVQNGAAASVLPSSILNASLGGSKETSSLYTSDVHNAKSTAFSFGGPTAENPAAPSSYRNYDRSYTLSETPTFDGLQPCARTSSSGLTQDAMLNQANQLLSVTPSFATSPVFNSLFSKQTEVTHLHVPSPSTADNPSQVQQTLSVANFGLSPRRSSLCAIPNSGPDVRRVALTDNPVPPLPPLAQKGDIYMNEGGKPLLPSLFTSETGMTDSLFKSDVPSISATRPLSGGLWLKPPNPGPSNSSSSPASTTVSTQAPSSPTTSSVPPFANRLRRNGKADVTPPSSDAQQLIFDNLSLGDRRESRNTKDTDEQGNIPRSWTISDTEEDLPEDFWGERPPVVEISENLDAYFPDHDLDQPFMDSSVSSSVSSRSSTVNIFNAPPSLATETICNPTAELPGIPKLSHKNSIRHMVQEAWQAQRTKSKKLGNPAMRRKSTKMWGVCVSEVAPKAARGRGKWDGISGKSSDSSSGQPIGKWVKGELIGKGSFGRVYHAVSAFGELIAVKQIQIPRVDTESVDPKTRQKLRALNGEIELMKDLDHENIVQYLGCDLADDIVNIFLEYVDGGTVSSLIAKHGPFPESVTRSFVRQILLGLEYLHDRRILHRDIKGANILVEQNGTCKISDFGISTKHGLNYEQGTEESNPKTSGIQGSIYWMAPEVIKVESCTETIDIWSLGCVTLEMLSGCRPWKDMDLVATMYKLAMSQSPPIPDTVPAGGKEFMRQCFIISPPDRPTAVELLVKPFAQFNPHFRFDDWTKQAGLKRTPTTLRRTRV